jgi:ketosteroid isomerase-like protein
LTTVSPGGSFVVVGSPSVQAYFDAVNREDYAAMSGLFTPDAELVAPGAQPRRGPQEIAEYLRAALAPYPEHVDEPTRIIDAGSTVVVEIRFAGAVASGARVTFDAVDLFDLGDDGRIARLSSWYDSYAVREQLRTARMRESH